VWWDLQMGIKVALDWVSNFTLPPAAPITGAPGIVDLRRVRTVLR
jgi:hypothetical protein